jgi:hypothetical protein
VDRDDAIEQHHHHENQQEQRKIVEKWVAHDRNLLLRIMEDKDKITAD